MAPAGRHDCQSSSNRSSDFAGGVLLLSRGSERKRRADPSALLSTSYRRRRAVINQERESRTTPLVAECAASISRRRYTIRAASRSLRLARSALASCDPRTNASAPSRSWDGRLVDVLDAERRESLGVDFRAWRSGRLKSSGTSAM